VGGAYSLRDPHPSPLPRREREVNLVAALPRCGQPNHQKKVCMGGYTVCPFGGSPRCLDIDFRHTERPELTTEVLRACTRTQDPPYEPVPLSVVWNASVSDRIGMLLEVLRCTEGMSEMEFTVRCTQQDCGELLEVSVPIDALLHLQAEASTRSVLEIDCKGSGRLRLRRPTGYDQLRWLQQEYSDESSAYCEILKSLAVGPGNPDSCETGDMDVEALSDAMSEFDPLSAFSALVTCPHCNHEAGYPIDLERLVLDHLQRRQALVVDAVHVLAAHYGWTEEYILDIPEWRRREYLKRIGSGKTAI
jgi:hypothetical protein